MAIGVPPAHTSGRYAVITLTLIGSSAASYPRPPLVSHVLSGGTKLAFCGDRNAGMAGDLKVFLADWEV